MLLGMVLWSALQKALGTAFCNLEVHKIVIVMVAWHVRQDKVII